MRLRPYKPCDAADILKVRRITIGVLENNPGAYHCYKSVGFRDVPEDEPVYFRLLGEDVKCLELEWGEA